MTLTPNWARQMPILVVIKLFPLPPLPPPIVQIIFRRLLEVCPIVLSQVSLPIWEFNFDGFVKGPFVILNPADGGIQDLELVDLVRFFASLRMTRSILSTFYEIINFPYNRKLRALSIDSLGFARELRGRPDWKIPPGGFIFAESRLFHRF